LVKQGRESWINQPTDPYNPHVNGSEMRWIGLITDPLLIHFELSKPFGKCFAAYWWIETYLWLWTSCVNEL